MEHESSTGFNVRTEGKKQPYLQSACELLRVVYFIPDKQTALSAI